MSVTGTPAAASAFAVPPVDKRLMPRAASAFARGTSPFLSDTDNSACVIGSATSDQAVFVELRPQRIAVEAEHVGRMGLIAVRALEHRRQQRALDVRNDHVVDAVRRFAIELAVILIQRALDAATYFVAAVETKVFSHAARASPTHGVRFLMNAGCVDATGRTASLWDFGE